MMIETLLEIHLRLYEQVYRQRERLEAECSAYNTLLEPWDLQVAVGSSENVNSPCSPTNKEDNEAETEEVTMINKLLARAERTRNAKKQVTSDEKDKNNPKQQDKNQNNVADSKSGLTESKNRYLKHKDNRPKSVNVQIGSYGVISQSKLNHLTGKGSNSSVSKRGSTITPIHARAPFKTEPEKLRRPVSKCSRPRMYLTNRPGSSSLCKQRTTSDSRSVKEHELASKLTNVSIGSVILDADGPVDAANAGTVQATKSEAIVDERNQPVDEAQCKFDLLKDGSKLIIPSKLQKMLSRNRHLRQKLEITRLTAKVDNVSQKHRFLECLEEIMEHDERIELAAAVYRQIVTHRNLLKKLQNLGLDSLSDITSDKELLHKRMTLEMILQKYEESGSEVATLYQGSSVALKESDIYPHPVELPVCRVTDCKPQPNHISDRVNASHHHNSLSEILTESIDYKHEKDLLKYVRLKQTEQMLSIHKQVAQAVSEILLPSLESEVQHSPHSARGLYRAAFSILSFPGHQPPSLVMDNMEDS